MIPSHDLFTLINIAAMALLAWGIPLQMVPIFIWLERKGSAVIQDRIGPNRAEILGFRLFGMLHNIADVVKLLMKEDLMPGGVHRTYYLLAPFLSMSVALLPLAVIPFASPLPLGENVVSFQVAGFDLGLLLILAITSLGVFGIMLAGWASNSKFSLMGGLRSSAQMISYELSVGLAVVGLIMSFGYINLLHIVEAQGRELSLFGHALPLPNWGLFLQPVGFLLFLVGSFAETNRNPFDLAEGESELVAGYHTEYSSMKFALFFMAEYSNMTVAAIVLSTLFLGGYQVPFAPVDVLRANPKALLGILGGLHLVGGAALGLLFIQMGRSKMSYETGTHRVEMFIYALAAFAAAAAGLLLLLVLPGLAIPAWLPGPLAALVQFSCLMAKALFFCWLFVWVRWTLPRFRYDQLMNLGWKLMLPLALLNVAITGILVLIQR